MMISNRTATAGTPNMQFGAVPPQNTSSLAKQSEYDPTSVLRHDTLTLPAWPFKPNVKEMFPHLMAWNGHHTFIKGEDEVVRRFPCSHSESEYTPLPRSIMPREMREGPEMLSMAVEMLDEDSNKRIFDFSGPGRQAKVVAGYELDPEGQVMAYELNEQRMASRQRMPSLLQNRAVFALGDGPSGESQYMVCQSVDEESSGAFACRDMLLTEGKSVAEAIALLGNRGHHGTGDRAVGGSSMNELIERFTRSWDRPPVLQLRKLSHEKGLQELKEKLDKHGSCMLGFGPDKWVMLDRLEQVGADHWAHRTRSPFHGTVVESHTKLGGSDGQTGSRSSVPTFGQRADGDESLQLGLTDAIVAIFRPALLPSGGSPTQREAEVVGIPV